MEEVYRHPPFDPRRLKPTELDPVVGPLDRDFGTNFRIETSEGWYVERRGLGAVKGESIESRPFPSVVKAQRTGWFLEPRPLHRRLRRMVDGVAIVMLLTLLYLALAPGFDALNIPTFGTKSVRLGLLDYPPSRADCCPAHLDASDFAFDRQRGRSSQANQHHGGRAAPD